MLRQDFSTAYEFQKWKNPTHRNRTYCGSESCIAILLFPFVILLDIYPKLLIILKKSFFILAF